MMARLDEQGGDATSETLSVLSDAKSPLAEAFRSVRTNLLFSGVDRPHRRVLVTSAVPREGKTTTAANLGMTMALAGTRTLLIDADLRRPGLHRHFQLSAKVGLTSLLGAQADFHEAIQNTEVPELSLLPSGPQVLNPAELLSSRRMTDLVNRLQQDYDLLIFDSPPVVTVADALVLAGISDGVLLVIRSGGAPHDVVARAKKQIEGVNAKILGAVLNAFDFKREGYYSAYSYYYYPYANDGSNANGGQASD
jgi:capsular exopolysaccharide synthesis family protein